MSRLIETIRVAGGKLENIGYHFQRMKRSQLAFEWDLDELLNIKLPSSGIHKLRVVYNSIERTFDISPYTIRPVRSLKLVFDNNIVYDRKFEDRIALEHLLKAKGDCDEILIIKNDLVTDVSYANIVFKKGNDWFTPDSFLLNGTMRQWLLDNKRIKERRITVNDIAEFSHFKLINAMLRDEAPESEVLNIR
jgi:4-amino-4-deoxychorismate lyase